MSELEAKKFDQGKPRMELLPTEALEQISRVLAFGAQKYGDYNWRSGLNWSRLIGAAYRHLSAFNDGQDLDPETGISHLAHAGCCIMFLLEYQRSHKDKDDRFFDEEQFLTRDSSTLIIPDSSVVTSEMANDVDELIGAWSEEEYNRRKIKHVAP